jgi:nucleotide-binding universal stress UspA family protein
MFACQSRYMKAMGRILVPVDGSDTSSRAVDFSIALAKGAAAEIVFFHAVVAPGGEAGLGDALERARTAGIVAEAIEGSGPPARAILEFRRDGNFEAVVMGTRGTSRASRFFLGGTAEGVLCQSRIPVFVVPSGAVARRTAGSSFRRIEVALDASESGAAALQMAIDLAEPGETNLLIAHASDVQRPPVASRSQRRVPAAGRRNEPACTTARIAEAVDRANAAGVKTEYVLLDGPTSGLPLESARLHGADLIVVGKRGWRDIEAMVLWSVADGVLRDAMVPVLVVPAAEKATFHKAVA